MTSEHAEGDGALQRPGLSWGMCLCVPMCKQRTEMVPKATQAGVWLSALGHMGVLSGTSCCFFGVTVS